MNRFIAAFLGLVVVQLAGPASAGPLEEVAQLAAARGQAFQEGNADAYSADFADNAVLQSSFSPFRIEGKTAINAYFVELFLMYPRRHLFVRQPAIRAYNEDLVVQDGYSALNLLNERGEPRNYDIRYSLTWAKTGGRWQIVDQHVSRLPTTP